MRKNLLLAIMIFSIFAELSYPDCTQDIFCTNCPGIGKSCALCTDNTIEAQLFEILQPNGTCYAGNKTNGQEYINGGNITSEYRIHLF